MNCSTKHVQNLIRDRDNWKRRAREYGAVIRDVRQYVGNYSPADYKLQEVLNTVYRKLAKAGKLEKDPNEQG